MRVKITLAARHDLVGIAKWIAKDSPQRASAVVNELREACRAIGEFPDAFQVVYTENAIEVRRKVYGNFLIFYLVRASSVEILYVLHASRDWEAIVDFD